MKMLPVIAVILLAAMIAVFFGYSKPVPVAKKILLPTQVPIVKSGNSITITPDTSGIYKKFTLTIPETWKLTENPAAGIRFTLKKDDATLTLVQPPMPGMQCLFPDTDMSKVDAAWKKNTVYSEYAEIPAKTATYRRIRVNTKNETLYMVCESRVPGEPFRIPAEFGSLNISVSNNAAAETHPDIDNIISTITYE